MNPGEKSRGDDCLVGVISDTHGHVQSKAVDAIEGVRLIIHAGDIGGPSVLDRLREIAPVVAVQGNVDRGDWARELARTEVVEIGGALLYVIHDLDGLDLDPAAAGFSAVLHGHSHRPLIARRNGVLYLNPGSAGPRRFKLPTTLALLRIHGKSLAGEVVELEF